MVAPLSEIISPFRVASVVVIPVAGEVFIAGWEMGKTDHR